jgi:hypothetical protein
MIQGKAREAFQRWIPNSVPVTASSEDDSNAGSMPSLLTISSTDSIFDYDEYKSESDDQENID